VLQGPGVWFSDGHPAPLQARKQSEVSGSSPKIVLYSHDTFGMGNIRRRSAFTGLIAEYRALLSLIITGSPHDHAFRIPKALIHQASCLDRLQADNMRLAISAAAPMKIKETREAILRESVLRFNPDLMVWTKERPASTANFSYAPRARGRMAGTRTGAWCARHLWTSQSALARFLPQRQF